MLHHAAKYGQGHVCLAIMDMIEDKNPKTIEGLTPPEFAAQHGHKNVSENLMNKIIDETLRELKGKERAPKEAFEMNEDDDVEVVEVMDVPEIGAVREVREIPVSTLISSSYKGQKLQIVDANGATIGTIQGLFAENNPPIPEVITLE